MNKQQFLAMSAITDLKGFVDGRSTNVGRTMYTLHSVPNKCKTVQISATMYEDEFYVDIDKFKPILHPLSDLKNEIENKGETFVPIEKLGYSINYCLWFDDLLLSDALKLIEWHFDVAGLIEQGEAIDVNTLDTNPYK